MENIAAVALAPSVDVLKSHDFRPVAICLIFLSIKLLWIGKLESSIMECLLS